MHVLFVHKNYPAQFGHIARRLVSDLGWQCTFVSERPPGNDAGLRLIQYQVAEGSANTTTHYCSRTFENAIWHSHAVYQACESAITSAPDLIVGHSGFGSTLFLSELFNCPIINYFEFYYRTRNSDIDFRPDFPPEPLDYLRTRARNATMLLDLDNCDAGYCPTEWQRSLFPPEFLPKLNVYFDGIDCALWRRLKSPSRRIGDHVLAPETRVVTYVSSSLESMRGFDIFMKVARRIYHDFTDVFFIVVGSDQVQYGGDMRYIEAQSFREHVLQQDDYDLSRFCFTGTVAPERLVEILSLSDLHIYLTVPFVLSWSLFNALACECVVLASNTEPVREVIHHGENGLLNDFFDVDRFAEQALGVLRDPHSYQSLGQAGADVVRDRYSLDYCLPRLADFYKRVTISGSAGLTATVNGDSV
jgi:glycosyltransferase involved in cell wall biosynthesis